MQNNGRLIVLEGVDGAGKTTHLAWLVSYLQTFGVSVLQTREPGGTSLGEKLREMVLHESMSAETETLLMFAARCEHLSQVILPALAKGAWVVCDRFSPASYAYQGAGKGVAKEKLDALCQLVHADLEPDLVLLFDVSPDIAEARRAKTHQSDKFEVESQMFFERVRNNYLQQATANVNKWAVLNSQMDIEQVRAQMIGALQPLLSTIKHV